MRPVAAAGCRAYTAERRGVVTVRDLDSADCPVVTRFALPHFAEQAHLTALTVGGGQLWVATDNHRLAALRSDDGHLLWNTSCGDVVVELLPFSSHASSWLWPNPPLSERLAIAAVTKTGSISFYDASAHALLFHAPNSLTPKRSEVTTSSLRLAATGSIDVLLGSENGAVFVVRLRPAKSGRGVACSRSAALSVGGGATCSAPLPDGFAVGTTEGDVAVVRHRADVAAPAHDAPIAAVLSIGDALVAIADTGAVALLQPHTNTVNHRVSLSPRPVRCACTFGVSNLLLLLHDGSMRVLTVSEFTNIGTPRRSPMRRAEDFDGFDHDAIVLYAHEDEVPSRGYSPDGEFTVKSTALVAPTGIAAPMDVLERCLMILGRLNRLDFDETAARQQLLRDEGHQRVFLERALENMVRLSCVSREHWMTAAESQEANARAVCLAAYALDLRSAWIRQFSDESRARVSTSEGFHRHAIESDCIDSWGAILIKAYRAALVLERDSSVEVGLLQKEIQVGDQIRDQLEGRVVELQRSVAGADRLAVDAAELISRNEALVAERDVTLELLKETQQVCLRQSQDIRTLQDSVDAHTRDQFAMLRDLNECRETAQRRSLEVDWQDGFQRLVVMRQTVMVADLSYASRNADRLALAASRAEGSLQDVRAAAVRAATMERNALEELQEVRSLLSVSEVDCRGLRETVAKLEVAADKYRSSLRIADEAKMTDSEEIESLRRRLAVASQLADDTLMVSNQQRDVLVGLRDSFVQLRYATEQFCGFCEAQLTAGGEVQALADIRALLRDAAFDLASARRDEPSSPTRSPRRRGTDALSRAYERVKLAHETCFPKNYTHVVLDRTQCIDHLHKIRSALTGSSSL
jgi:hypothetical protein